MTQNEKMYMNAETGSVDNYAGWDYENENGETVNAVELGEVFEVILNEDGDWVEGEFVAEENEEMAETYKVVADTINGVQIVESFDSDVEVYEDEENFFEELATQDDDEIIGCVITESMKEKIDEMYGIH